MTQHTTNAHHACIIKIIPHVSVINFTPLLSGKSKVNIKIPTIKPTKKVTFAACRVPLFQKYPIIKTADIEGAILDPMELTMVIIEPPLEPAIMEKRMDITITTKAVILPKRINWLSDVSGLILFIISKETKVEELFSAAATELIKAANKEAITIPTKPTGNNSFTRME